MSISRKLDKVGYRNGRRISSQERTANAELDGHHPGMSGKRIIEQGILYTAGDFGKDILLLAAEDPQFSS